MFGATKSKSDDDETTGWAGGFDVLLGNPPWERIKLLAKEFFAAVAPEIATTTRASERNKLVARLETENPVLWTQWKAAALRTFGTSHFLRKSSAYPTTAFGDLNNYSIFAERMTFLTRETGISACVVPPGIVTDKTLSRFFFMHLDAGRLYEYLGFINEKMLFSDVLHNFKFGVLVLGGSARPPQPARFVFNLYGVEDLQEEDRFFSVSPDDVRLLNPDSLTCPVFFSRSSAELVMGASAKLPLFDSGPESGGWEPALWKMFDMSNDSGLFSFDLSGNKRPLFEAKMISHYNHRYGSYEHLAPGERSHMLPRSPAERLKDPCYVTKPFYFVRTEVLDEQLEKYSSQDWLLIYRWIASVGLERTFVATVVPKVGLGNSLPIISFAKEHINQVPRLLAMLNSLVFDFFLRQRLGGANVTFYIVRQSRVVSVELMKKHCSWEPTTSYGQWLESRVLELVFTSWDLESFGVMFGADQPFVWNENRRFVLQREIDAAMCHLYGLSRSQVEHICDCFPILQEREISEIGDYRTKLKILEIYDAMQQSIDTGEPYQTLLDPPPADPSVAHPESSRPDWAVKES